MSITLPSLVKSIIICFTIFLLSRGMRFIVDSNIVHAETSNYQTSSRAKSSGCVLNIHLSSWSFEVRLSLGKISELMSSLDILLNSILTSTLDGGERLASRLGCFVFWKISLVSVESVMLWDPQQVFIFWRREKSLAASGSQTTVPSSSNPYPSLYIDWANPATINSEASLVLLNSLLKLQLRRITCWN